MTFVSLFHSAKQKELSLDHQGAFFGIPGGIQVSRGDYRVYREYKTSITVWRKYSIQENFCRITRLPALLWADQQIPRLWTLTQPPTQPLAHLPVFPFFAFYPLDVSGKVLGNIWQLWPSLLLLIPFPHLVDLPGLEESRNFQGMRFCWKFTFQKEREKKNRFSI